MTLTDVPEVYKSLSIAHSRSDDERWRFCHRKLRELVRALEELDEKSRSLGVEISQFVRQDASVLLRALEEGDLRLALETLSRLEKSLRECLPIVSTYSIASSLSRVLSSTAILLVLVIVTSYTAFFDYLTTLVVLVLALSGIVALAALLSYKTPFSLALQAAGVAALALSSALSGILEDVVVLSSLLLASLAVVSATTVSSLGWLSSRSIVKHAWRRGGDLNPRPPG